MDQAREATWKGDLYGGVTAAIVALPLALAFGVAAFSYWGRSTPPAVPWQD